MASGRDKRKYPRVHAEDVSAHLNVADKSSPCTIQNISAGGLFIETQDALPVGMPVAVNLARPGWTKVLRLSGRVVWAMAGRTAARKGTVPGMRIRFDPLPRVEAEELIRLLKDLGAPDGPPPKVVGEEGAAITQPVSLREIQQRVSQAELKAVVLDDPKLETMHGSLGPAPPSQPSPIATAPVTAPVASNPNNIATAPYPAHAALPHASNPLPNPYASNPPTFGTNPNIPGYPNAMASAPQPMPIPHPSLQAVSSAPRVAQPIASPQDPKLIVQVQGLMMQLGELQTQLELREKELQALKEQIKVKDSQLERAERERKAAELAIQRLSMQLSASRR
jgi:Tfp pilus assembly protein PilZ